MAAVGHPSNSVIPVRGGAFGHPDEVSLSALFDEAFGEHASEALVATIAAKQAEIAKKKKADEEKAAAEEAKQKAAEEKAAAADAAKLHAAEDKEAKHAKV